MIINANIFVHTYTLKGIDKNKTITKDCGENAGQHNNQNRISVSFLLSVSYTCKLCCQTWFSLNSCQSWLHVKGHAEQTLLLGTISKMLQVQESFLFFLTLMLHSA